MMNTTLLITYYQQYKTYILVWGGLFLLLLVGWIVMITTSSWQSQALSVSGSVLSWINRTWWVEQPWVELMDVDDLTWSDVIWDASTWDEIQWLEWLSLTWWLTQTWISQNQGWSWWIVQSWTSTTGIINDVAHEYARKVERLISIKWQETRANMITTMHKFMKKMPEVHPLYRTVQDIIDIIVLWEVAHKVEYCTQYDWEYHIELFGMDTSITSVIKYDPVIEKCMVSYKYQDGSIHTCSLNESQKVQTSRTLQIKQYLEQNTKWMQTFESLIEWYVKDGVCIESQSATVALPMIATWTTTTWSSTANWWKFNKK